MVPAEAPSSVAQGIEPQLGQPMIGTHENLLWEDHGTALATDFLSKLFLCEVL